MPDTVLEVENLRVYYYTLTGVVRAVEDVSLEAYRGEMLAVVGESGSGKSTLGLSLLRMVPPPGRIVSGEVRVAGVDILSLRGEALRRARGELVSIVFQDPFTTLDPVRRVGEQLSEVLIEHGVSKSEAVSRAKQLLELVGLPRDVYGRYPHQLSGGQRQRVAIAAAVALEPAVLVADEPTTALDVVVQEQIMDLLDSIRRRSGTTIILVTHDIALAAERADRIAVMYAGQLVEYGPAGELVREPRHPYTKLLLDSVPDPWRRDRPRPIPGTPPDLRRPPPGCRFHPRCPWRSGRCSSEEPPLVIEPGGRRGYRCWHPLSRQASIS